MPASICMTPEQSERSARIAAAHVTVRSSTEKLLIWFQYQQWLREEQRQVEQARIYRSHLY